MKILISANGYPTPQYPLQSFVGVISRELVRQGHDVTVLACQSVLSCIKHKIGLSPTHFKDSVKTPSGLKYVNVYRPYVLIPASKNFGRLSRWNFRYVSNRILDNISEHYDVIYSIFWSNGSYVLKYADKHNIPIVVEASEDKVFLDHLGNDIQLQLLKKLTKGVVCVSSKNLDECIDNKLANKSQCTIIPNGYDPTSFRLLEKKQIRKDLGYSDDDFIVAFCGRFNDRKGVFRLEKALSCLNKEKIKSIFIGRPIEGQEKSPSCEGILFCGTLPHDKVAYYLNAADVYVLPTLAEGCSNSIAEAMACGLPIISSDLPFNYDILDETNSILLNPMNIDEIKDAILKLYNDRQLVKDMSNSSLEKAKELNIEKRIEKIVNYIQTKIK